MNANSPHPALPAAERILPAAVLALCAILVMWEIWLAPIRQGGSWLALKALPLAIALPGLFRGERFACVFLLRPAVRGDFAAGVNGRHRGPRWQAHPLSSPPS